MKAIEPYFPVVLFMNFQVWGVEIFKRDHSNKNCWTVLSGRTVFLAVQSGSVGKDKIGVTRSNKNRLRGTFLWYRLFLCCIFSQLYFLHFPPKYALSFTCSLVAPGRSVEISAKPFSCYTAMLRHWTSGTGRPCTRVANKIT